MLRSFLAAMAGLVLSLGPAAAQTCGSGLPYTLTNGTNADATQVMANFNYVLGCPSFVETYTAPTLTVTSGKRDILTFVTNDGGTTWFGFVGGQNF